MNYWERTFKTMSHGISSSGSAVFDQPFPLQLEPKTRSHLKGNSALTRRTLLVAVTRVTKVCLGHTSKHRHTESQFLTLSHTNNGTLHTPTPTHYPFPPLVSALFPALRVSHWESSVPPTLQPLSEADSVSAYT